MRNTAAFNCPGCKKPFDFNEGEPNFPGYHGGYNCCACKRCGPGYMPHRGLMDFLNQPAFKKTDTGYEYTLPINDPACFGCEKSIRLSAGASAFVGNCGHYLCQQCDRNKGQVPKRCPICDVNSEGNGWRIDGVLLRFFFAKTARAQRLIEMEDEKEEARKKGDLKSCAECGSEQNIACFLVCTDCKKEFCGNCFFDSPHRTHTVKKLLGVELHRIEKDSKRVFTEILEGLHQNIKYIQTTIDKAISNVMTSGKRNLQKIKMCTSLTSAHTIVRSTQISTYQFERHCEEYIPVARELATRLTELGENISKDEE